VNKRSQREPQNSKANQRSGHINQRKPSASPAPRQRRGYHLSWGPIEKTAAILGGLAALVALIVYAANVINHFRAPRPPSKLQVEEKMTGQLVAGEDYARVSHIIGVPADYQVKLASGNRLYQYERHWETLQLVVGPSGKVLSVGVYAKTPVFRPRILLGTTSGRISLNKSMSSQHFPILSSLLPDRMNAYCGAHKAGYFEAYDDLPNALAARSVVVGISDAETSLINVSAACSAESLLSRCAPVAPPSPYDNHVYSSYARCMLSSSIGRRIHYKLTPSVLIVTAPAQKIVPDMLYPPDDVLGL
jgi:hypothetical protein